ncbi:Nif3-like dinuclear metal center hexameric protein [Conexibacter woesei]|uniref:GTP cyclohydrolase 1 type 2 homolog n=1 Tax=Conexibacter woesei (strain DSM 14684 / CCUG 47730 / CIP 108061 / JCM 11494 / NBRC 100937 / ID131577) TaxID=469383 RepID=D3F706_CONWI|nr:Nif3-like dinuclear metal center hexameric protein [Conexibacter woesei]ADB52804.1 protein of unknown function DUF34 [Conexibacter woesei DSM 14684]
MTALAEIMTWLDDLLEPGAFKDFGPNGLQVPGREQVVTVVTGVSAHVELLERAIAEDADLLLVHHGLIWDFQSRRLHRRQARRLRLALEAELNLVMYHLPLDAHPEVGNNALLAGALGADAHEAWGRSRGRPLGRMATFAEPVPIAELLARVTRVTDREPLAFTDGPAAVRRLAIMSGGSATEFSSAIEAGADAFLTGEPAEHVMADAAEAGVHFIAAGHHATERFGARRVGELLAERFGVRHTFIDVPNPV